ncbi:MAG: hypothetical protein HY316_04595 [Acidobacteria bacterium]|nr:hypothetical protein [Acidobacteriota bacterium]
MAPYAVAHFKLGMQLAGQDLHVGLREKWAYDFSGNERLGVFLTNTLEEATKKVEMLFGSWIAHEANAAVRIKRDLPILVVMGNPPYSGHSANRSYLERIVNPGQKYQTLRGTTKVAQRTLKIRQQTFIGQLIEDYKKVDGKGLGERNPKWLQDDYVKFIRWGQWRIGQTGAGILAFITNNGYLDNPTFRGMRQQLMNAFTEICVLDLHGSSKKKEQAPDGSPDENVFDIQQGVTLGIFIKEPDKTSPANVYHAGLWGVRKSKHETLFQTDVKTTRWTELTPQTPLYLFVPRDVDLLAEYEKGWKLPDVFPVNSVGIVTARDSLTIHWSKDDIWKTVRDFAHFSPEDARERYELGPDAQDWKVELAQRDIRESGPEREKITPLMYRPFDYRFTYYTGRASGFLCRPRPEAMGHMLNGKNLALLATRQTRDQWDVLATPTPVGHKSLSAYDITSLFPLYLYPLTEGETPTRWPTGPDRRQPNLNPDFVADLEKRLGLSFVSDGKGDLIKTFGPEDVFNYIYAGFHSPTYRTRYAEFLKSDFPRVPLTSDANLFRVLCGLGGELVALHLLESPKLAAPIARFPVKGASVLEKGFPKYVAPGEPEPGTGKKLEAGRVYISKSEPQSKKEGQYFEGVPKEVWEFHIGGYQVCEKWLKDRRGRTLTYEDLEHYAKVVTALKETIRLMAEIDAAIPHWPIQ